MGRTPEIQEVSALIPPLDLGARVVYLPVRHHSPACAWHVDRLIRQRKPKAVLIEGPRDATPLLPLLTHPETRMPVAFYTTYVRRRGDELPDRFAAYYPLCEYSPELAAIRAAVALGIRAELIDLTFPEMIEASERPAAGKPDSLLQERRLSHSRLLQAACQRSGARDPDDLWDHLYEVDYQAVDTSQFFRNVLAYCALARQDHTDEMLTADGCLVREAAMAAAVAREQGPVVVITGGFHTVALARTSPRMPEPVKVGDEDAGVVLMRYGFEQLDRLNGYASGMPSPEFYQRLWDGRDCAETLVELGRLCREKQLPVSTADAIAAVDHTRRLAQLRGHPRPSREDVLDGARSLFIKGADGAEGTAVLAITRKLLAGDRVGNVPAQAGLPPIVDDFRRTAAELRMDLDRVDAREVTLDLYRKTGHRAASRFLHQLQFVGVPFATWVRGPDFVHAVNLERIQEVWRYHWTPETEASLIRLSLYGATVRDAAAALLMERFQEAEKRGQGGRADVATRLVLDACTMGLHGQSQDLLARTASLVAEDQALDSLVVAMEHLMALHVSREPLEAHHLEGLEEMAAAAYHRACYVLPELAATPAEQEDHMLDALNALHQAVTTLGDTPERKALRWTQLGVLAAVPDASPAIRGGAGGLLYGDGQLPAADVVRQFRGHLHSVCNEGTDGPNFLRGLLRTARSVLWQVPECIECLHAMLRDWEEEKFVQLLPLLRLALADLTPREADRVARAVAAHVGVSELRVPRFHDASEGDLLWAARVNQLVHDSLTQDGLEPFGV